MIFIQKPRLESPKNLPDPLHGALNVSNGLNLDIFTQNPEDALEHFAWLDFREH